SFVHIFGFSSANEALESNLRSLFPRPSNMDDLFDLLRRHRMLVYHEAELRRTDGTTLSVIENIVGTFDTAGTLVEIEGYVYDNTSFKQLEDEFRQAQKMESIGTLAGGIAHDFNNILAIIVGYTSLLMSETSDREKSQRWAEAIRDAAERGSGLVRQLLTFAQKTTVRIDRVHVNDVVNDVVKMLSETFPKTIIFELHLGKQLPQVYADHSQLHQSVLNLCVNARDAMPKGGSIMLSTGILQGFEVRRFHPEAQAAQYVFLKVVDNGTGINEATRSRIFEPFFTTKERGRGTGLGLAVVYGVMRSLKGFVDVATEVGKGTTFTLFFPVVENISGEAQEPQVRNSTIRGGSETLLIVEDEEKLIELLQTFLGDAGYRVLTVNDGEQAIELYKREHKNIAFVLIDIGLPKLEGDEVYLRLKEINPKIKAVLASGNMQTEILQTMNAEGVCGFLSKPYDLNEILRKIREVLDAN
ncbi:MAG: response regulator, partial [Bacteroidota bacterium]|nr:response regulator [Bacteroidota bacterium]